MEKEKSNYLSVEKFTPFPATREDVEKIKAILMDIAAEQASKETSGEKWFTEVAEAIREI